MRVEEGEGEVLKLRGVLGEGNGSAGKNVVGVEGERLKISAVAGKDGGQDFVLRFDYHVVKDSGRG